ncbi:MAG: hypothetical protein J5860_03670 [Clostridia bacterium]|nr:hypothetical protein [Clostridia bacterium]
MSILQISGVALVAAFAVGILKIYRSDLVFPVSAVAVVVIVGAAVSMIAPATEYVSYLSEAAGFSAYFEAVLKALGISVIADTAAGMCRDGGHATLASKVEFAAKIMILALALPIIKEIVAAALEVVK